MLLPGTTVDGSELLALALAQAFLAPELFARKFPHGHWHDLYAFLTPMELVGLLCDVPQVAELLDMEDVAEKPAPDRWLAVIASQNRFHTDRFAISSFGVILNAKKIGFSADTLG